MIRRSLGLSAIALLVQVGAAAAEPLDKETCDKLQAEQTQLEGAGVRSNMANGPEWAKANLTPDKLAQIKRLIEVEELLAFRCGSGSRLAMPDTDSDDDEDDDTDNDDKKVDHKTPPAKKAARSAKSAENKGSTAKKSGASAKAKAKK